MQRNQKKAKIHHTLLKLSRSQETYSCVNLDKVNLDLRNLFHAIWISLETTLLAILKTIIIGIRGLSARIGRTPDTGNRKGGLNNDTNIELGRHKKPKDPRLKVGSRTEHLKTGTKAHHGHLISPSGGHH